MNNRKKLLVLGFGGHARSVADIALANGYKELLFVDPNARADERFLAFPVLASVDVGSSAEWDAFPASGDGYQRKIQCEQISKEGFRLVTLIAPSASVGVGCVISDGCFVGQHAHIGPMARIGHGCIVNTGAIVEHECEISNFAHVSVNAVIAGRSKLGAFSMLGAGATIVDGIAVADDVVIGAGAVVHRAISASGTYIGIPARKMAPLSKD